MAMQEVLDERYGTNAAGPARRSAPASERKLRPSYEGVAPGRTEPNGSRRIRRAGFGSRFRLTFRTGIVPRSTRERVFACLAVAAILGFLAAVAYEGQRFMLHDSRFVIPSSAAIQIEGNSHMTRAQLLSVFGEDVDRNIFRVSLDDLRTQLESLPWVAHATVMRLLPNHLRVSIIERTPIAFVRQGKHIGLVDPNGVLLDLAQDNADGEPGASATHYSFPVVTGISADEPRSVRAGRMKIFQRFAADLDRSNENISARLSEVDLSNPEDVKALIPDHNTEILVHFGDRDFLERYRKFEEELPGWRTQYPRLASADMRYERQVVLEMQPGTAVPLLPASRSATATGAPVASQSPKKLATVAHPAAKPTIGKSSPGRTVPGKALSAFGQPHFPAEAPASPAHPGPARIAKP